MSHILR